MTDAANLDGVGIGADEEEPVVPNSQPKLFSSLEGFHIAGCPILFAHFAKRVGDGDYQMVCTTFA